MIEAIGRAFEPLDLTRIKFVTDPQLSPDGRRVAFVVTSLSEEKDEYISNIWIVDTKGGESRQFTTGLKRDLSPRWSPDGQSLAFTSDRDPKKKAQLYLMPAHGGEPRRLTDLPAGAAGPVWSPDSTRIALISKVGGPPEPDSDEEKAKSRPAQVITTLKYRLNGEGYVNERYPHLFVVDAVGGVVRQITEGSFADSDPAWSPDNQAIAFESARHAGRDTDDASDIFVVNASGGEPVRVTDTAGPARSPVFSPDGNTIAFLGSRHRNEAGRNTRVFAISATGGEVSCLTAELDRNCTMVSWNGDGSIFVRADHRGDVVVYRLNPDRPGDISQVLGGRRQIADVSGSADGSRVVYTATDPITPAEVFICSADGNGERQLTDLNRDWKATVDRRDPEHFVYERAGFEIDGWMIRPFGFEPGRRYPLLLVIHGGPATQYGTNFFDEFQVYAGAGYAVLYLNPRGSQGHGEDFTRAVVGDWGGGDFADVMAGLDAALRQCSFVDPERLGVMGGSYGGYLTSWIVSHCDRFKAACSERALNYFPSFFGTSDIGPSFTPEHAGGLPWTHAAWYAEHSPFTYAARINTPLLIMHSEQDLRCPIEQAEQLYITLKVMGKVTKFIRFPDENHELTRSGRPRHRLERFRYILEWFEKYLGGGPNAAVP